ncbi:MAG: hypothetical protein DRP08_08185, partial [Candidatus Aenigmatarchaeota archaeon]
NLAAHNSTSGDINIDNTGDLTITTVGSTSGVVNNPGNVNIKTHSDLILVSNIVTNNTVNLDIDGAIIDNHGGYDDIVADSLRLKLKDGMGTSSFSNNTLETQVNNLAIYTQTGTVDLLNTGSLAITEVRSLLGSSSGVINDNGDIYISTRGTGANLTLFRKISALNHLVSLNINGAIIDGHAGTDIYADSLELLTLDGIKGIPGWNSFLETQVSNLAAHNSTSGDINIDNTGDLTITTVGSTSGVVNNGSGIIDISTASPIYVNSDVISSGGNIYLTANNSDGFIEVNGQILSNGGNIYLTAYGKDATNNSITIGDDVDADTGNVILDSDTSADSAGNISTSANGKVIGNVLYIASDGSVNLNTNVAAVGDKSGSENTYGSLTVNEDDNVNLGSYNGLSTDDGDVNVTAQGTIWITDLVAGGSGDITLGGANVGVNYANAEGNEIKLTANNGDIFEYTTDTDTDIISQDLILSAKTGIGSGNALETEVSNLQATNTTSGNIEIDNTGNLTIFGTGVNNNAPNGQILITTASNMNINAPINSNAGYVYLSATDDIDQNASITTSGGDFEANADSDGDGSGGYDMKGSSIDTTGTSDGNVTIIAGDEDTQTGGEDIKVGTINAGDGTVTLTTYGGSIYDQPAVNIIADTLHLNALNDIHDLTTNINNLYAYAGGY